MSTEVAPDNRPPSNDLHRVVYVLIIVLALWFILSVWLFAGGEDTDYLLVVLSGFIFIAVGLPTLLWRVWRKSGAPGADGKGALSFRDWISGDFATWQDRLPAANAAVEILLPIAAVAFGMTALGLVLHFTAHGAL